MLVMQNPESTSKTCHELVPSIEDVSNVVASVWQSTIDRSDTVEAAMVRLI